MGSPTDEQQLPADGPGPGESQADYERRVHGQAAGDGQGAAPFDQASGQAQQPQRELSAAELRQLADQREQDERAQAGATNAAAIGRPAGPPAGGAAAALGGQGAPAVPPAIANAPVGSLGAEREPVESRMDVTHTEPVLSQGAQGDSVDRLVKLLAAAGYASNTIVHGENPHGILDRSVMADVERFWDDHPEAREPDELFAGREGSIHELQGTWVGPYTWQVLYDLAGAGSGEGH